LGSNGAATGIDAGGGVTLRVRIGGGAVVRALISGAGVPSGEGTGICVLGRGGGSAARWPVTRGGGALVRDAGSGGIFNDADEPDDGGIFNDADEFDGGSGGIFIDADEPLDAGTGGGIFIDPDEFDDRGSGGIVVPRDGGAVIDRIGDAGGTFVCVPDAERVRGSGATSPCATGRGAVIRAGAEATFGALNMRSSPGSLDSGLWLETISMSSLTAVDSVLAMFTAPANVVAQDCERIPIAQAKSGDATDELRERVA
jgi:hypothetical protein